jgi:hypothetical protein
MLGVESITLRVDCNEAEKKLVSNQEVLKRQNSPNQVLLLPQIGG